jgi:hemoglobin
VSESLRTRQAHRCAAACFLLLFALSATAQNETAKERSLYERLGGESVVTAIVNDLLDASSNSARTRRSFDKVNLPRLKKKIAEQICALTQGPCVYDGDDMKQVHAGQNITQAEFYGLVEDLIVLLDRYKIGLREKNELLAILAPMKRDIVTR